MSKWKQLALLSILTLGITTSAFANPDNWGLLSGVKISEEGEGLDWKAVKEFPASLQAATDGFTITGFAIPIVPEAYVETFLLVADPDDCPFCGSSGYGPVLEVHLKRPIGDLVEFAEITVRGTLELIDDPQTFQAYRLLDAYAVGDES